MKASLFDRRTFVSGISGLAGLSLVNKFTGTRVSGEKTAPSNTSIKGFSFSLNASTIRGQNLGIEKEIEIAAKAGYDYMEIWIDGLQKYKEAGGSISDLKKKTEDLGIGICNAIGFAQWIVDDNDTRNKALEQAKREMDLLSQVGCYRIAAPPAGATNVGGLDLTLAGERFRTLVELGVSMGVIPHLELWGFSKNLYRLSQVMFVAAECGHPQTRILPDVYHLYKGGSDYDGLKLLSGDAIEIFHVNDYPAEPSRNEMNDSHRVYPGDGTGPVVSILKDLYRPEKETILSLELFNRDYWKQDASEVARTGLEKMKAVAEQATK